MTQTWCAEAYADEAAFVSELGSPVVALLEAKQGENILDLGCGDGTLALQIQELGAGRSSENIVGGICSGHDWYSFGLRRWRHACPVGNRRTSDRIPSANRYELL